MREAISARRAAHDPRMHLHKYRRLELGQMHPMLLIPRQLGIFLLVAGRLLGLVATQRLGRRQVIHSWVGGLGRRRRARRRHEQQRRQPPRIRHRYSCPSREQPARFKRRADAQRPIIHHWRESARRAQQRLAIVHLHVPARHAKGEELGFIKRLDRQDGERIPLWHACPLGGRLRKYEGREALHAQPHGLGRLGQSGEAPTTDRAVGQG